MSHAGEMKISGLCPMGCGPTLVCMASGYIVCSAPRCPRPMAVDELLAEASPDHLVQLGHRDFSIIHPLAERLDGMLLVNCELNEYLEECTAAPQPPGLYRVRGGKQSWTWIYPADMQ